MGARLAAIGPCPGDPSAVLFADAPAIEELGAQLRSLSSGDWTTELATPPVAGEPALRQLSVRAGVGALRIAVEGDGLVIAGHPTCLERLAKELGHYAEHNDLEEPGMHCHVDYRTDNAWIAADSLPLMVAGWVRDR